MLGHLPEDQHDQAKSTFKAAFKLDMKEGVDKIKQYATWLEREWPSAAGSLRAAGVGSGVGSGGAGCWKAGGAALADSAGAGADERPRNHHRPTPTSSASALPATSGSMRDGAGEPAFAAGCAAAGWAAAGWAAAG